MELKMFTRRMWPGGQLLFDISSQVLTIPDDVTIKEHAYPLFMGPNNEKFALQLAPAGESVSAFIFIFSLRSALQ